VTVIRLTLEYDGREFAGWAAQPGVRTVEGELGRALATALGRPVKLAVAGRTDAGVHAWGQVASFALERDAPPPVPERLLASLNGLLPGDVVTREVGPAPDGFDARRDARSRTYCYRVLARAAPSPFERGRALWVRGPLDEDRLSACARALVGSHDFTAFTPAQTDHIRFDRRVLRSEWLRSGDILQFWIEADAFMRQMVRVLVGTMLEVAVGRREVAELASLLGGAPRSAAGPTAAPDGLYLAAVSYRDGP
jgi:tRNA pseudouridine38-40 synthase